MFQFIVALFFYLHAFARSRHQLGLEILALRQQVIVLKRKRPRPRLKRCDRLFWVALRSVWSQWSSALVIVKPVTVAGWHQAGFRLFWRWRSRASQTGRPKLNTEVRMTIQRMASENPTWGAPRIHGELLLLGFEVSERSVSRYLIRLLDCRRKRRETGRFSRDLPHTPKSTPCPALAVCTTATCGEKRPENSKILTASESPCRPKAVQTSSKNSPRQQFQSARASTPPAVIVLVCAPETGCRPSHAAGFRRI
jgi:hypothetical protein